MNIRTIFLLASFGFLLSCAVGPSKEKIGAFGSAVSKLSDQLKLVRVQNSSGSQEKADIIGLNVYLTEVNFDVEKEPFQSISDKQINVRLQTIDALKKYGDALKTTSEFDTSKLKTAVDGLVSGVTSFNTASGFDIAAIPIFGSITKLAGKGVEFFVQQEIQRKVVSEIRRVDPYVSRLGILLDKDIEIIVAFVALKMNSYKEDNQKYLRILRGNTQAIEEIDNDEELSDDEKIKKKNIAISEYARNLSPTDIKALRSEYFRVVNYIRDKRRQIDKLKKSKKIIAKMVSAHHELAENHEDEKSLVAFLDALDGL